MPVVLDLDCKGLRCPLPIVQLSLAVKKMQPGDTIRVAADDPAFHPDLMAWANKLGHRVLTFEDGDVKYATVEKRDAGVANH